MSNIPEFLEVKFGFTPFKLEASKSLRKNICWLIMGWNKVDFDGTIFYFLMNKMPIDFKIFGFVVKLGVFSNFNTALIITPKSSGLLPPKTKFMHKSA
jgi:hypothetical protein